MNAQDSFRLHADDPTIAQRMRAVENMTRLLSDQSAETAVAMSQLDTRLKHAVSEGLRDVLADDELMDGLLDRLRARVVRGAAERTGRWLWDSIRTVFSKWLLIGVIVVLVGQAAGLAPAKAVLGWLTKE